MNVINLHLTHSFRSNAHTIHACLSELQEIVQLVSNVRVPLVVEHPGVGRHQRILQARVKEGANAHTECVCVCVCVCVRVCVCASVHASS